MASLVGEADAAAAAAPPAGEEGGEQKLSKSAMKKLAKVGAGRRGGGVIPVVAVNRPVSHVPWFSIDEGQEAQEGEG